uniref:Uncharacterized protein n=1 Tax=Anguilla anguilla TaxID=7936 RepID=A0A0E9XKQ5_ANGAN
MISEHSIICCQAIIRSI